MSTLSPIQIKAATLLASGQKAKDVASEIICTPETISHWKKKPEFEAYLNQLRQDLLEQGRELLRSSVADAMTTMRDIVTNSKTDEVRRKAAMDILRMSGLDGDQKSYGAGIGKTEASEIIKDRKFAAKQAEIIDSLCS